MASLKEIREQQKTPAHKRAVKLGTYAGVGAVAIVIALVNFWPSAGLPECSDLQVTAKVRSLLKDEYRRDLAAELPTESIEVFVDQVLELKAVRRVESESESNSRVCECELHGRKFDASWVALQESPESLQNVSYEVFVSEDDEVWVQLLEND